MAAGLAVAGGGPRNAAASPAAIPHHQRIKLGDQTAPTSDAHLAYLARYGVRHICGYIRGLIQSLDET